MLPYLLYNARFHVDSAGEVTDTKSEAFRSEISQRVLEMFEKNSMANYLIWSPTPRTNFYFTRPAELIDAPEGREGKPQVTYNTRHHFTIDEAASIDQDLIDEMNREMKKRIERERQLAFYDEHSTFGPEKFDELWQKTFRGGTA